MRQFIQDLTTQMRGIWARLEGPQRLVVAAVLLATFVGLGGIVWFAGQPSYEVVFSATSGEETARVQQALQKAGLSWQLDDSGMRVLVERNKVGQAKSAIAGEGLIGGAEVSLDSSGSFIEDAATKKWRLNNATRAQAEQAIMKLDGVHSVTVTASKPDRLIAFRDRQREQKAKATVVLGLRPGAPFESTAYGAASIAASQLMVPVENIDVFSANGAHRWSYNPDRNTGAGSSEFLAMQRDMSDTRTRIAQAQLEQLYGDKISVQVHVELDPKWEVRREKVLPTEPILKMEDKTKDSTDSGSGSDEDAGSPAKSKNEKSIREYVTEIGEKRSGVAMPEIKRITVAVLYDKELETEDQAADRPALDKVDLEKTVKAIVGWSAARDFKDEGDPGFSIMSGSFQAPASQPVAYEGPGMGEVALQYAPAIGQLLGVAIVVLFLRGLFKRSRKAAPAAAAPAAEPAEVDLAPEEQQRRIQREVERSIAGDPAAMAKMLETWLMEQKA